MWKAAGGIVGASSKDNITISDNYNKGKIIGNYNGEVIGNLYKDCTKNNLFYLSRPDSLKRAIGRKNDDNTKKIMEVQDDLTYEQFKTWILEQ